MDFPLMLCTFVSLLQKEPSWSSFCRSDIFHQTIISNFYLCRVGFTNPRQVYSILIFFVAIIAVPCPGTTHSSRRPRSISGWIHTVYGLLIKGSYSVQNFFRNSVDFIKLIFILWNIMWAFSLYAMWFCIFQN